MFGEHLHGTDCEEEILVNKAARTKGVREANKRRNNDGRILISDLPLYSKLPRFMADIIRLD